MARLHRLQSLVVAHALQPIAGRSEAVHRHAVASRNGVRERGETDRPVEPMTELLARRQEVLREKGVQVVDHHETVFHPPALPPLRLLGTALHLRLDVLGGVPALRLPAAPDGVRHKDALRNRRAVWHQAVPVHEADSRPPAHALGQPAVSLAEAVRGTVHADDDVVRVDARALGHRQEVAARANKRAGDALRLLARGAHAARELPVEVARGRRGVPAELLREEVAAVRHAERAVTVLAPRSPVGRPERGHADSGVPEHIEGRGDADDAGEPAHAPHPRAPGALPSPGPGRPP
mmetsp:Transcript_56555/g.168288  ORF Transcript_56555/g.168288 Transcript_56555/m.168288 type:complete len:293 (-) Transcript_56555:18-896(-)